MQIPKWTSELTSLQIARERLLADLDIHAPDSEEYCAMLSQVETLSHLIEKETPARERLSPNTLVTVAGHLGVAGLLIWFEREHVITTKALQFLPKLR